MQSSKIPDHILKPVYDHTDNKTYLDKIKKYEAINARKNAQRSQYRYNPPIPVNAVKKMIDPVNYSVRTPTDQQEINELIRMAKMTARTARLNRSDEEYTAERRSFMTTYSRLISKFNLYTKMNEIFNSFQDVNYSEPAFDKDYLGASASNNYQQALEKRIVGENLARNVKESVEHRVPTRHDVGIFGDMRLSDDGSKYVVESTVIKRINKEIGIIENNIKETQMEIKTLEDYKRRKEREYKKDQMTGERLLEIDTVKTSIEQKERYLQEIKRELRVLEDEKTEVNSMLRMIDKEEERKIKREKEEYMSLRKERDEVRKQIDNKDTSVSERNRLRQDLEVIEAGMEEMQTIVTQRRQQRIETGHGDAPMLIPDFRTMPAEDVLRGVSYSHVEGVGEGDSSDAYVGEAYLRGQLERMSHDDAYDRRGEVYIPSSHSSGLPPVSPPPVPVGPSRRSNRRG